jgi:hypothetical protein
MHFAVVRAWLRKRDDDKITDAGILSQLRK